RDELELGNGAHDRERLHARTRGQEKCADEKTFHAALRVDFCAAIAPETSRRTTPKAAVTTRLTIAPGAALGRRSVWLRSATEYVSGLIHMIALTHPCAVAMGKSEPETIHIGTRRR